MIISAQQAEQACILQTAQAMATAARTAPTTRGQDYLHTLILTGDELERLAAQMEQTAEALNYPFFARDAGNVRRSGAVLLLGIGRHVRGLNAACGYCGSENCAACAASGNTCVYDPIDLGIAAGSAVSVAAAAHVDNRIMFSAGAAAKALGYFPPEVTSVLAIPLSASGKSVFFDRK